MPLEKAKMRTSEASGSKSEESRGRPKKEEGSIPEMALQLMVTMMETMKEIQKKTNEGREDSGMLRGVELVRAGVADLPALPPWSPTTGPLQLGDWMLLITPVIADLSLTSEEWWSLMTKESEKWFQAHMALGPIDRLQHAPAVPVQLQEDRWQRLERRVSTMILQALPEGVGEELVSARRLSVFGVLTLAGLLSRWGSRKQTLLRNLEELGEIQSMAEAPAAIRRWMR